MNAARQGKEASATVRLAALAALASFCAFHWANLVTAPPVGRVLLVVAISAATAWALVRVAAKRRSRVWTPASALFLAGAGLCAGLIAAGLPIRLLAPANWGELGAGIGEGITAIGDVTYPYDGDTEWARLVLLAALPLLLGLGVALAFWPARHHATRLRLAGLGVFVTIYAVAAVLYAPGGALLHGFFLFALVAAWLWAPRLAGRRLAAGAGIVIAAGAVAIPAAAALDRSSPLLNYRDWTWAGAQPTVGFDWNHSYGPLDWPRDGTPLLEIRSEAPHYWRSTVLESFDDGFGWVRTGPFTDQLELPSQVEGVAPDGHREWLETVEVAVRDLRSSLVVAPGSVVRVDGLSETTTGDGTTLAGELPVKGQTYEVDAYAPDPSAAELRDAPAQYPASLSRFTFLELPEPVSVPLRGERDGHGFGQPARPLIEASEYAPVYELARRLARGAPTAYDAVKAIEDHLQGGGYTYTEDPPISSLPLRSFLLNHRLGYCQQFSGAMALMLRMNGIPSRVVSGFSPGSRDADSDDLFTVRDTDAHSWTEVYFPSIGWVPFDSTPAASPASSQSERGAPAATPGNAPSEGGGAPRGTEEASAAAAAGSAGNGGGLPWAILALAAMLALLGGLATMARRRLRFRSLAPASRVEAQVQELSRALERARYRASGEMTLLALERRLRSNSRPAAAAYAARLRAYRYQPQPGPGPGLAERRAVRRELARSRGRLRAIAALPPGGPALRPAPHG